MTTTVTGSEWAHAARALTRRISRLGLETRLNSGIRPNFTAVAPNTHPALMEAWKRAQVLGYLDIWNGASEDAIYVPEVNLEFRFWHDMGHISTGLTFTPEDERELQERHHIGELLNLGLVRDELPMRLYVADTIGQIEYSTAHGDFPGNQKAFAQAYVLDKPRALETVF